MIWSRSLFKSCCEYGSPDSRLSPLGVSWARSIELLPFYIQQINNIARSFIHLESNSQIASLALRLRRNYLAIARSLVERFQVFHALAHEQIAEFSMRKER